MVFNKVFNILK